MPYAMMRFEKRKGGPASAIEKYHERKVPIRFRVLSDVKALCCQGQKLHRNTKQNWEKNNKLAA